MQNFTNWKTKNKLRWAETNETTLRDSIFNSICIRNIFDEFCDYVYGGRVSKKQVDKSRPMDRTGFKKSWYALLETCKIDCRFHDLRHSYATRVFGDPSINPVVACKSLGMSMKTAMKHYIHFSEEQLSSLNKFEIKEN